MEAAGSSETHTFSAAFVATILSREELPSGVLSTSLSIDPLYPSFEPVDFRAGLLERFIWSILLARLTGPATHKKDQR